MPINPRKYLTLPVAGLILIVIVLLVYLASLFSPSTVQTASRNSCDTSERAPMILVKGGSFTMGAAGIYDDEFPNVQESVDDFYISRYEVTNKEFAEFVNATGYKTVAEKMPDLEGFDVPAGTEFKPGSAVFVGLSDAVAAGTLLNWWHFIEGANWRHPNGPESHIKDKDDYPVVHIALADALAYAQWKGHRLPTEAEYEYAARGGLKDKKYATGDTLKVNGQYQANTWQGVFPFDDKGQDGFIGIAPVGCFEANGYGINDLIGNVWEWTSSTYYPRHFEGPLDQYNLPKNGYDKNQPGMTVGVVKGGSYLCAEDFCARYRPAARHAQDTQLGTSHIGFRTVKDVTTER